MEKKCIGVVKNVSHNGLVRIEPFLLLRDSDWFTVKKSDFPNKGLVFDPYPRTDIEKDGDVILFTCMLNSEHVAGDQDRYTVSRNSQSLMLPMIDLSGFSLETTRKKIYDYGILFNDNNLRFGIKKVVFKISDNDFLVLDIQKEKNSNLWKGILSDFVSESERFVDIYHAHLDALAIEYDKNKYICWDNIKNLVPVERFDWSVDYAFFERVTRKIITNLKKDDSTKKIKKDVDAIRTFLQKHELLPDSFWGDRLSTRQIISRINEQIDFFYKNDELINLIVKSISVTDEVKRRIEEEIEQGAAQFKKDRMAEIEAEYQKLKNQRLEQISKEILDAEKQLLDLKEQKEAIVASLDNSRTIKKVLNKEITKFTQIISQASALEYPHAKALAEKISQQLQKESGIQKTFVPRVIPPWVEAQSINTDCPLTESEFLASIQSIEKRLGLKEKSLVLMDGLLRAGELLALMNDDAEEIIRSYAAILTSGEVHWFQPDPSTIGLDDLWRVPATQLPTAFSLAWHHAEAEPTKYQLVCLHKIDVAPYRYWLESLFDVLQSPMRPKNLIVLVTFSRDLLVNTEHQASEVLIPIKLDLCSTPVPARLKINHYQASHSSYFPVKIHDIDFDEFRDRDLNHAEFIRVANVYRAAPHVVPLLHDWPKKTAFEQVLELKLGIESLGGK